MIDCKLLSISLIDAMRCLDIIKSEKKAEGIEKTIEE